MIDWGLSPEYIENAPFLDVLEKWLTMQDYNERENARLWLLEQEREIDEKVSKPRQEKINGQMVTVKPTSIEFNKKQERKKRYKGLI